MTPITKYYTQQNLVEQRNKRNVSFGTSNGEEGVIPSFDMACSNKVSDIFYNTLDMKYFQSRHLYLENGFSHIFYILHFQQLLSQSKIGIITYMPSYIYVVIHICGITYSMYMSQIQEIIENNQKEFGKIQDEIATLKKLESNLERENKAIALFENGHVGIIDEDASSVTSVDGNTVYLVNNKNGTCQCKDHEFRGPYGIVCAHRIADQFEREEYDKAASAPVTFASAIEVTA